MSATVLWAAGSLSKEMKGQDWQKPLAAFQHLRFHGKKNQCPAARALQQIWRERTGLVLQHWRSLQRAAGAAVVCEWHWFVLACLLTAIADTCSDVLLLPDSAWGEEGEGWAHRGSCVLLRQASGLGNVLGCKTAVGRAGGDHVLAFMSCEDGEMECFGGGALCTGQSKCKGNYWCRITASPFLELFISSHQCSCKAGPQHHWLLYREGQKGMRVHRPMRSQFLLAAHTAFSKTHLEPYSKTTAYFKGKKSPKELNYEQLPKQVDAIAIKTASVVLSRLVNSNIQLCVCVRSGNEGITHFESFLLRFV